MVKWAENRRERESARGRAGETFAKLCPGLLVVKVIRAIPLYFIMLIRVFLPQNSLHYV